jgi:hypothetical protein
MWHCHSEFGEFILPGDQEGLFKLVIQLRTFFYSAIYNTAIGYVLWVYLTDFWRSINNDKMSVKINDKKKSKLEFGIII